MRRGTLWLHNLVYYRRRHAGTVLGVAVATGAIVGALVVGDSMRHSLERLTDLRLGRATSAVVAAERLFRAGLADDLATALHTDTAAVLLLRGTLAAADGTARAAHVQVVGVDERFWALRDRTAPPVTNDLALFNRKLARRLNAQPGQAFVLRVERAAAMPGEAPFAHGGRTVARRLTCTAIVGDAQGGRFSLAASQIAPQTLFVPRAWLARALELPDQANTVLIAPPRAALAADEAGVEAALHACWTLADASLSLRPLSPAGGLELTSPRIFLDPPAAAAALALVSNATGVLTYLANELRVGERATPYSFVSAPGAPLVPPDLRDDEIVINDWLAQDLAAKPGDRLTLRYFRLAPGGLLTETGAAFRVRGIVPLAGAAADRTLMPALPGLSGAANCRDWDPGAAIDLKRIRQADEDYWSQHGGTPKAFIALAAAQRLWSNRFGSLTAIRIPPNGPGPVQLSYNLLRRLRPAEAGLQVVPVRAAGLAAAREGTDFGGLFIGLSFFVVTAALMLAGMLFALALERRTEEIGLLLAVGWRPAQVRRLLLAEGALLAVGGSLPGVAAGVAYSRALLAALAALWPDTLDPASLQLYVRPTTLAVGWLAGALAAVGALWLRTRRLGLRPLTELQVGAQVRSAAVRQGQSRRAAALAGGCILAAVGVLLAWSPQRGYAVAGACFAAGALLLTGGLSAFNYYLLALAAPPRLRLPSLPLLGLRNAARRRAHTLTVTALLACGVFMVVAVGANRRDPSAAATSRASGTGGFAFIGELAAPVTRDLNAPAAGLRATEGTPATPATAVVPIRVREGDDASCLNLHRARQPRLLGVPVAELDARRAFTFAQLLPGHDPQHPWRALEREEPDGTVPAFADLTVIQWGLGRKVGDTLEYRDEHGRPLTLRLVGALADSIFQGSLLIGGEAFARHYPSVGGARMLLVDAASAQQAGVAERLARLLEDNGLELVPSHERLKEFLLVENTWLSVFLVLGGLGVLIGTLGLAVVVARRIEERQQELALLRAVGFARHKLATLLLYEHVLMVVVGTVLGVVAGIVAVLPALLTAVAAVPLGFLSVTVGAIAGSGLVWTALAAHRATRGLPIERLQAE